MDENNLNLENQEAEVVEEATEEITETVEETVEEIVEESEEEVVEEISEEQAPQIEDDSIYTEPVDETIKKKNTPVAAIVVAVVVVIAVVVGLIINKTTKNPYNPMNYPVADGMTIGDVAEGYGVELSEFIATYGLPEDMPEDTPINSSEYYLSCNTFAMMAGYENFEALKEVCQIPDETTVSEPTDILGKIKAIFVKEKPQPITGDTYWGVALDEITLGIYVGEENMEQFKEVYGITDEITVDTKYKEVRPMVEEYNRAMLLEQIEQMEEAQDDAEDEAEDVIEDVTEGEEAVEADADVSEDNVEETAE